MPFKNGPIEKGLWKNGEFQKSLSQEEAADTVIAPQTSPY